MMELVAMHLKQRGALVSRALSFKSCTFELVNDVMTPSLCGVLVLSRRWRRRGPGRVDAGRVQRPPRASTPSNARRHMERVYDRSVEVWDLLRQCLAEGLG